jgi:hypothetical protein
MAMNAVDRSHKKPNNSMGKPSWKCCLFTHSRIMKGNTSTKLMIAGNLISAPLTINPTGKSKNAAGTTISGLIGRGQKFGSTSIMSKKRMIAAGEQRMRLITAADLGFASMFFIVAPSKISSTVP